MLASEYDWQRLEHPFFVQPKLRGLRALLWRGQLFGRSRERFTVFDHLDWFPNLMERCIIDGELWHKDLTQQQIQGAVVRDRPNEDTHKLIFNVFDIIILDNLSLPFVKRLDFLQQMNHQYMEVVPTTTSLDPDQPYKAHLASGYEGTIYRNRLSPYEPDCRSYNVMKRKPWTTSEAIVCGVQIGKGRHVNRLGAFWVHWQGKTFKVGGGDLTDDLRERFWTVPPINLPLTFRYQYLSDSGVPQHPQFEMIRYEHTS